MTVKQQSHKRDFDTTVLEHFAKSASDRVIDRSVVRAHLAKKLGKSGGQMWGTSAPKKKVAAK